jgi:hypothetical protein
MKTLIEKIKKMGGYPDTAFYNNYLNEIEVWRVKGIDSSTAQRFLSDNYEQVYKNNGLIFQFNSYVPKLSIEDLDSPDKIDSVLSEEYTIELLYCPVIKEAQTVDLTDFAYQLANIRFDFGEYRKDVSGLLSDISEVSKFVPFNIEESFLMGSLQNIVDVSILEKVIEEKYIPLLSTLGRLDETPAFIKSEVLRSKFIMI